jgi:hypothetical protein
LVPGIGTQPELSGFQVAADPDSTVEPNWVGCPWGSLKINSALVERLRLINQRLEGKVHYKFFVTVDAKAASVPVLWKELVEILGRDKFTLYANLPYPDYIKLLRKCNFALDAWPFGGNTSVIDCMFSQVPIVTQKGWQFYNMAGPVILERFGLHELVTRNENDYIETALRLFTAQKSIRKLREKMAALDVAAGISSLTSTEKYVEAFDYMMGHPRNMKITKPLEFV